MAFQSVFRSLCEVFPQVDLRILKAVAIEHSVDVDAAVEFILSDVLPNEMENLSAEVGLGKQAAPLGDEEVEILMTLLTEGDLVRRGRASDHDTSSAVANSLGMVEAVDEGSQVGYAGDPKEPSLLMPHDECFDGNIYPSPHMLPNLVDNRTGFTSNLKNGAPHLDDFLCKTMVDAGLSDAHGENNCNQVNSNAKLEQDSLGEHFQCCMGVAENLNEALHSNGEDLYELNAEKSIGAVHSDVKNSSSANVEKNPDQLEYGAAVNSDVKNPSLANAEKNPDQFEHGAAEEVGINHYVSESEVQQSQFSGEPAKSQDLYGLEPNDTASSTFISGQDTLQTVCDESSDSMDAGAGIQKGIDGTSSEYEEQKSRCLSKTSTDLLSIESELPSVDVPSTLATRSGHLISIEFLEEFIIDAKNNKENLMSAKESVTNLMKEVEQLEERAKQTKEAALTAGQDILLKVVELKQMLKHAKEANDMHTGEVYGEKVILATEARELQSRLLSLSDERNKSLSVIEEIRQALEARRSAAEEKMAMAELEKLEREELARKALREQELIMDAIAEESKKLKQEAEENTKLREFLMDSGNIVDALQGEIAVTCEDVMLLKARVDGCIPPGKSQRSTSSLVSSSSSSCHGSLHSSDGVLSHVKLDDQDSSKGQQQESGNNNDTELNVGRKLSVPSDDDWAFLEFEG
ncbi:uncharacterized protein [Elaeis guineensis]|uniref:Uncharacterized protein LOC105060462 n=1 Tax=Elaeis guineensis var. tenera TaxID=51953 RepID=A0A6I9SFF6_ELAGV|nr:uncharacterized protein LOC105060462 [Elaeis guineensis]XP_010942484.1 uncharacterized protein LOC105060462 [Elaeis guineensis]